jgi:hypothetical protein
MPVEVSCTACGGRFRVPDSAAGKRIKCPKCKAPIEVPRGVETWTLKTDDGAEYGPVPRTELDVWHQEGRITAECQLLKTGAPQWQWASDLYADLAATQAAPTSGFVIDAGASRAGSSIISRPAKSSVGRHARGASGRTGVKGSQAVTYLAYASYAICGMQIFFGILITLFASAAAAMISGAGQGNPQSELARSAGNTMAMFVFAIGIFAIILSIPALLSGYGLMNRQRWGRVLTLILGTISILTLNPLGMAYGVWTFIVLLDKKYADEFR